ncbi:hypothetical protein [Nannocystis bainbridge]|uniref:Uncharacterized protein n=1 Tax=Nannocystis bainbridge TaxID=2995303 RepID=A0ABT5DYM7_9BACT|nr:hypothetical protein [Nannocystis bainbridge]MDC0718724.1 hypothetical protein [Nannocystis bainbridge]
MATSESAPSDAPSHAAEAALADAERRLAALSAELQATRESLDRERSQRAGWDLERGGLRGDLAEARRRLDAEAQAHAQTRGAHDLIESRVAAAETEVADARREANRQRERGDRAQRELDEARRELEAERSNHRATRERTEALEGGRAKAGQELTSLQAQVERAVADANELRLKLTADQTVLLEAQARCEAQAKELTLLGERAAAAKRALADETGAHAETRRRLEELRESLHEDERRRQRKTIAGVVGGAALGAALFLRRRLGG